MLQKQFLNILEQRLKNYLKVNFILIVMWKMMSIVLVMQKNVVEVVKIVKSWFV